MNAKIIKYSENSAVLLQEGKSFVCKRKQHQNEWIYLYNYVWSIYYDFLNVWKLFCSYNNNDCPTFDSTSLVYAAYRHG